MKLREEKRWSLWVMELKEERRQIKSIFEMKRKNWLIAATSLFRKRRTPPQAKRGKRANNSTLLFLAVRGKPKKRESWFAFLLFHLCCWACPLALLASSIKNKLNLFFNYGMIVYGAGTAQASRPTAPINFLFLYLLIMNWTRRDKRE